MVYNYIWRLIIRVCVIVFDILLKEAMRLVLGRIAIFRFFNALSTLEKILFELISVLYSRENYIVKATCSALLVQN